MQLTTLLAGADVPRRHIIRNSAHLLPNHAMDAMAPTRMSPVKTEPSSVFTSTALPSTSTFETRCFVKTLHLS
jgi:hypothetical protein